eukprot:PhM_4_TR9794/c0_g1_i1/m.63413
MDSIFTFRFLQNREDATSSNDEFTIAPSAVKSNVCRALDVSRSGFYPRTIATPSEMDVVLAELEAGHIPFISPDAVFRDFSVESLALELQEVCMGTTEVLAGAMANDVDVEILRHRADKALGPGLIRYLAWQQLGTILSKHDEGKSKKKARKLDLSQQPPRAIFYPKTSEQDTQTLPLDALPSIFSDLPYNRMRAEVETEDLIGWAAADTSRTISNVFVKDDAVSGGAAGSSKRPKVDPKSLLKPVGRYVVVDADGQEHVVFHHCTPTVVLGRGARPVSPSAAVNSLPPTLNFFNLCSAAAVQFSDRTTFSSAAEMSKKLTRALSRFQCTVTHNAQTGRFTLLNYSKKGTTVDGRVYLGDAVELFHDSTIELRVPTTSHQQDNDDDSNTVLCIRFRHDNVPMLPSSRVPSPVLEGDAAPTVVAVADTSADDTTKNNDADVGEGFDEVGLVVAADAEDHGMSAFS